jgi:excisionase family DNA binding protein
MSSPSKPQPTTQLKTAGIMPRMLSIPQASAYAACAIWAIREAVWSKELRAIKLGRRYVIAREDLDAFLTRKLSEAAA